MGAGNALASQVVPSRQVVVGIIGVGQRGRALLEECLAQPGVRIGAVCETYEPRMFGAVALARSQGHRARYYRVYSDLMDDTDLNAVIIATPDFWHSRMTLEAIRAGKDVYVEQPLCHTWQEGVELLEAEKGSGQIIQVGSQRRSSALFQEAARRIAEGGIGRPQSTEARRTSSYLRAGVLRRGGLKLPEPLNFPDWQAAAATQVPYSPDRFLNWRFYSMYGGGPLADLGSHVFDGIHLLTGAGFPATVKATGTPSREEGFDTAERASVTIDYPNGLRISVLIDGAAANQEEQTTISGETGKIEIHRSLERELREATRRHVANFFDCVRARKSPTAPVRATMPATLICQMANLSIAGGQPRRWDAGWLSVAAA